MPLFYIGGRIFARVRKILRTGGSWHCRLAGNESLLQPKFPIQSTHGIIIAMHNMIAAKIVAWAILLAAVAAVTWNVVLISPRPFGHSNDSTNADANETAEFRLLLGGPFSMGDDSAAEKDQRPAHQVTLQPFSIAVHEVTNQQFQEFVRATHYTTTAEKNGWSYVFDNERKTWVRMTGADWRHPLGNTRVGDNEPVVHVSWDDAQAYCRWANKKLPTEAQWEYAAKGGILEAKYPWGNDKLVNDCHPANYWQGWFPKENTAADGYAFLAPVGSFPPNRFGLYDTAGNVWEWCSDGYSPSYYLHSPTEDPTGPSSEDIETASVAELRLEKQYGRYTSEELDGIADVPYRVIRGGSFLSAENTDAGYRTTARGCQPQTMSFQDVGFRVVDGE
jgi:formylglycine-generating enzyme required for sulfatase activity